MPTAPGYLTHWTPAPEMLSGSAALGCPAPGVAAVAGGGDESPAAVESAVPRLAGIVKSVPRTTRR